jgi:hypothetical protein
VTTLEEDRLSDVLDELSSKNHLRVAVWRTVEKPGARPIRRQVLDELAAESRALPPAAVLHDHLRILAGRKPIYLAETLRRMGGLLVSVAPNLRTNAGINFCAANLFGTDGGQVAIADYIALSNNTNAPAAGDTSATTQWATGVATDGAAGGARGEWTGLGLTRKQATMAHTANATSLTASATWTATGASTSSQLAGLFGGAGKTAQSNGATNILVLESTFTATSLALNDQLSLTWTINI